MDLEIQGWLLRRKSSCWGWIEGLRAIDGAEGCDRFVSGGDWCSKLRPQDCSVREHNRKND
jgi:hypothetical protein